MKKATKTYRSPQGKLIAFFEKSRDAWKGKYTDAKYTLKKLQQQVRYANERKEQLKARVKELEAEVYRLRAADRGEKLEGKKKPLAR